MKQDRHSLPLPLQQRNVQNIRNIALQRITYHPLYSNNTLIIPHVFESSTLSSKVVTNVSTMITSDVRRGLPILLILDRYRTRSFNNSAFIFDFFTKQLKVS